MIKYLDDFYHDLYKLQHKTDSDGGLIRYYDYNLFLKDIEYFCDDDTILNIVWNYNHIIDIFEKNNGAKLFIEDDLIDFILYKQILDYEQEILTRIRKEKIKRLRN
jgi:hypothetical protein